MDMTVKELIEELKNYDENAKVWISVDNGKVVNEYFSVDYVDNEVVVNDNDVVLKG
jgi:hypothetical protein